MGESVSKPIEYYSNNLACTLNILDVMRRHNRHNIIFFFLCHGLRRPRQRSIREDFPVAATTNPYGNKSIRCSPSRS